MRKSKYLYRNGLSLVFFSLFLITLAAQALTGWKEHNKELQDESAAALSFSTYLSTGHFISSTFENFQSEFLQMALYVILTVGLRQQGSAESKSLDEPEEVDREPVATENSPISAVIDGRLISFREVFEGSCEDIIHQTVNAAAEIITRSVSNISVQHSSHH